MVATLVMAILSAIMACILISLSGISMRTTYIGSEDFITNTIEIVIGGVMLILCLTSVFLTFRPLCCSSGQQGLVYYKAPNVSHNLIDLPNLPVPTPPLSAAQVCNFLIENTLC